MAGSAKRHRTRLPALKRGEGLRFQSWFWYHLCTVCMTSILPSRSHGQYNLLLRCKGHTFLSNAELCSAEQHKYLWKRRIGSYLKGSFNRQRTAIGCYNTKPFFMKVQPPPHKRSVCHVKRTAQQGQEAHLPLRQGVMANKASSQASTRTHVGTRTTQSQCHPPWRSTWRIACNILSSPLSEGSLNTLNSTPQYSKGSVLLGTELVNSAHIEQGRESKGKPKFYLQIQKHQNSARTLSWKTKQKPAK